MAISQSRFLWVDVGDRARSNPQNRASRSHVARMTCHVRRKDGTFTRGPVGRDTQATAATSRRSRSTHNDAEATADQDRELAQRIELGIRISKILGEGRLDPFNIYPANDLPLYVHEILDHGESQFFYDRVETLLGQMARPRQSCWNSCTPCTAY